MTTVTPSASASSTPVIKSTTPTVEYTLADLDDPKTGFPALANEIRKLPDFSQDTDQTRKAANQIATLALGSTDPQVREALNIMIRGGTPPQTYAYKVPDWNTEIQALFWLAEQNEIQKDDTIALAIAMSHGIFISLAADDDARNAVYSDINRFLPFLRSVNSYLKEFSWIKPLERYPLEAKLALAWRGNDLGRFGRIYYNLGNPCAGAYEIDWNVPANIHNFYEFKSRPMTSRDYSFDTISIDTLQDMHNWMVSQALFDYNDLTDYIGSTVGLSRGFVEDHTVYPRPRYGPCENWIYVNGERTRPTNINNANYTWQLYKSTGKILGVSDDYNALIDGLIKSVGVPGVSLDFIWGPGTGVPLEESHEVMFFYEGNQNKWFSESISNHLSDAMDVFIFRPPAIQLNYFNFYTPHIYPGYEDRFLPNLYRKIIDVNGNDLNSKLSAGISSSDVYSWFFAPS